uniref:small monomeric GTPase n=1 Tax=Steinernema glaseri TaxID=37863 RepID=A0A1I7Y787_9BILA
MQSAKLVELHVALIGMTSVGKSALAVKYITRRFIGEYHAELEDTYCRQDTILNHPVMVWLMDTVDGSGRDAMRYLAWADVYVVVYDVTSQLSLQYAERLLQQIAQHEHSLCMRSHKTLLVGNKCDLERALRRGERRRGLPAGGGGDPQALEPDHHGAHHAALSFATALQQRLRGADTQQGLLRHAQECWPLGDAPTVEVTEVAGASAQVLHRHQEQGRQQTPQALPQLTTEPSHIVASCFWNVSYTSCKQILDLLLGLFGPLIGHVLQTTKGCLPIIEQRD